MEWTAEKRIRIACMIADSTAQGYPYIKYEMAKLVFALLQPIEWLQDNERSFAKEIAALEAEEHWDLSPAVEREKEGSDA